MSAHDPFLHHYLWSAYSTPSLPQINNTLYSLLPTQRYLNAGAKLLRPTTWADSGLSVCRIASVVVVHGRHELQGCSLENFFGSLCCRVANWSPSYLKMIRLTGDGVCASGPEIITPDIWSRIGNSFSGGLLWKNIGNSFEIDENCGKNWKLAARVQFRREPNAIHSTTAESQWTRGGRAEWSGVPVAVTVALAVAAVVNVKSHWFPIHSWNGRQPLKQWRRVAV